MRKTKQLKQAYDLQDLAYEASQAVAGCLENVDEPDQRARIGSSISALVRAWDVATERVRILRGRPMPGSLRPEPASKKATRKPWSAPVELPPEPATDTAREEPAEPSRAPADTTPPDPPAEATS